MKKIILHTPFVLESGQQIAQIEIAYHTYGELNDSASNVVWVCHALTANSDVFDWWKGLFGKDELFNPNDYFIICANVLGSCYGTTGPLSKIGESAPLLDEFPKITIRDQVNLHERLRNELGIDRINVLIGASLGGQQALEWQVQIPELSENLILIATNAKHSAFGIAFNASQRMAIEADSTYGLGSKGGRNGLRAARSIALLSYRSYESYVQTQTDSSEINGFLRLADNYQRYQGTKLADRFNAYSYYRLTEAMDSHDLRRGRGSVEDALQRILSKTLVVGISSDGLFPPQEQEYIAQHIPEASLILINSSFGHDGFLIETETLTKIIGDFLFNSLQNYKPTELRRNRIHHQLTINN